LASHRLAWLERSAFRDGPQPSRPNSDATNGRTPAVMKPIVTFDEAGNSGGNLLDAEQPVFVLASVSIPDDDAQRLLTPRDGEYKFSRLKRSSEGRQIALTVLDSPRLTEDRYVISAFHKKFMAVAKMVDLLIEPVVYAQGYDLYERGGNLALANMLHYCLPVFLGPDVFDMLIERFLAMVRTPSPKTVQNFYQLVDTACRKHRDKAFARDLAILRATRDTAEAELEMFDGSDLDPAIPAFVEHGYIWTERLGEPFRIVHDASKPIENEQVVLEAMMSETDERIEIGYDRRKGTFPIACREIELEDSSKHLQLQVADLIAGSAAYVLKGVIRGTLDEFATSLQKTQVLSGSLRRVWPEPKVTPEELGTTEVGGVDANEHVGEYVAKRLGGIPPKGQRRR